MKNIGIENLQVGKRYTLFAINDFGFPYAIQMTLNEAVVAPYAQYPEAVHMSFKPKGKRNLRSVIYTPIQQFAVWEGWLDVDAGMWGKPIQGSTPGVTVTTAKYHSFDDRYFSDGLASAPEPLVQYKGRYAK